MNPKTSYLCGAEFAPEPRPPTYQIPALGRVEMQHFQPKRLHEGSGVHYPSKITAQQGMKDSNPKDNAANGRVPLHMVPDTLGLYAAMAFAEGDSKYVAYNFRIAGVKVSVYVSALRRHLMRYFNGEWADKKTGVPHLASVAACTAILIDGHVMGTINDDRPPAVDLGDSIEEAERIIAHVYAMNKDKRPVGVEYTAINTGTCLDGKVPAV